MTLIPIGLNKKPLITWRAPRAAAHETTSPTFAPGARQWRGRAPLWARVIPEGAVVLDLDDGRGPPADWPATAELWTPRGVHLWYGSALRFTKRAVMIGGRRVDVCPAGTLEIVSGPGRWFVNVAIAELPGWLGDALGHHRTGGTTAGNTGHEGGSSLGSSRRGAPPLTQEPKPSFADLLNMKLDDIERPPSRAAYVRAAMDRLFWLVAKTPEGQRTIVLNQAAYRCGELGAPFDKAEGMLTRAAIRCGLDMDDGTDIQAVIRCGFDAGSIVAGKLPPTARS